MPWRHPTTSYGLLCLTSVSDSQGAVGLYAWQDQPFRLHGTRI